MFVISSSVAVHKQAFATEEEALASIVSRCGYLGATEHELRPDGAFGKIHHYLNQRTGRWNKGVDRVTEVELPV